MMGVLTWRVFFDRLPPIHLPFAAHCSGKFFNKRFFALHAAG